MFENHGGFMVIGTAKSVRRKKNLFIEFTNLFHFLKKTGQKKRFKSFEQKKPKTYKKRIYKEISVYNPQKKTKKSQNQWIIIFAMTVTVFFTIATAFYFYQVNYKMKIKKKEIIELYHKFEKVNYMETQSEILLKTLSSKTNLSDTHFYFLMDHENVLKQEVAKMKLKYTLSKTSFFEKNVQDNTIVLISFIIILAFIMLRLLIIDKEASTINKNKPFQYTPKQITASA